MSSENAPSSSTEKQPITGFGGQRMLVNRRRQEGNPLLKYIRNVPYELSVDISVDFQCSKNCGVLYLSLKYHKLHPGYIETRFTDAKTCLIKVILLLVNVEDPSFILRDLNMLCYRMGFSLVLSYSVEEAAEYLESFKLSENRNPETAINSYLQYKQQKLQQANGAPMNADNALREKNQQLLEQAVKFLSSIRMVSQTDAKMLLGTYGSICAIARASQDSLEMCPGLGPIKAQNVYKFFRTSFLIDK